MVSARLLLANGTIIEASDDKNPDLFWALRGAGHNFGIVLEATYQVYPQLNEGKHLVVDFEFELDKLEDVFEAVNAISDPMPKEVAVFVIGRRQGANGKVSSIRLSPPLFTEFTETSPADNQYQSGIFRSGTRSSPLRETIRCNITCLERLQDRHMGCATVGNL